jgi:hypothetical protein
MSARGFVVLVGDRFLGFGGDLVREYPDAKIFPTFSQADRAAERLPAATEGLQFVSCADYQTGNYWRVLATDDGQTIEVYSKLVSA